MIEPFDSSMALAEAERCLNCKNPRCVAACPAHVPINEFIHHIVEGRLDSAFDAITSKSVLPTICSRVCPHENQCEGSCIRAIKSTPISIGRLESYVADWNRKNPGKANQTALELSAKNLPRNGKRVAVVGSGPAGIACAYDLALKAFDVVIYEAAGQAGGVLTYGIPAFRLSKDIVKAEIDRLVSMGVEIRTGVKVGEDIALSELEKEYDAVFLAIGATKYLSMGIPGENLAGVYMANDYLALEDKPDFSGRRVIVVGGGNVAMDAARTARRSGADTTIVYRRTEAELPACKAEVADALEDGVVFSMLTNPVAVVGEDHVEALRCVRMELGEPDESGRRSPHVVEGSENDLPCDVFIVAIGSVVDTGIAETEGISVGRKGVFTVDENGMTSHPGVFAAGDDVLGPATVVEAMAGGRRAAAAIDAYLA